MTITRLLAEGEKAWWQFWKKAAPEPVSEPFTILGQEPVGILIMVAIMVPICYAVYAHPKWFFQGVAESFGWVIGLLSIGVVIGGVAAIYTASLSIGVAAFVVYLLAIAFLFFAANAT